MTAEKILEVIEKYRDFFQQKGIGKVKHSPDEFLIDLECGLEHCHYLFEEIADLVRQGRLEKAFRWLGFIQGVMWSARVYRIADLKDHNRPPREFSLDATGMPPADKG